MRTEYIALKVEGEFHWGFSIRFAGASASAHAYIVPPPTTLIGAIARNLVNSETSIFENKIYSSAMKLLSIFKVMTFRYLKGDGEQIPLPIPFTDIIKASRIPYIRIEHRKRKEQWFGISGFGRIYAPATKFNLLYVVDYEKLKQMNYNEEDLKKAALSMTNIGSKEGMTSIQNVEVGTVEEVKNEIVCSFYVPFDIVERAKGSYTLVDLPYPDKYWYVFRGAVRPFKYHRKFLIPARLIVFMDPCEVELKISKKGVCFKCSFPKEEIFIAWYRWSI